MELSTSLNTKQIERADRRVGRSGAPDRPVLASGLLPQLLGYQLRLAHLAVFGDFSASVGSLGITPGRLGVLLLVEANEGVAQTPLAAAAGLDRSTMVPLLDQLEQSGWLERRRGPDRRTNGLWLTVAGRDFLARAKVRIRAHERRIAACLSAKERAELIRLLGLLRSG